MRLGNPDIAIKIAPVVWTADGPQTLDFARADPVIKPAPYGLFTHAKQRRNLRRVGCLAIKKNASYLHLPFCRHLLRSEFHAHLCCDYIALLAAIFVLTMKIFGTYRDGIGESV